MKRQHTGPAPMFIPDVFAYMSASYEMRYKADVEFHFQIAPEWNLVFDKGPTQIGASMRDPVKGD